MASFVTAGMDGGPLGATGAGAGGNTAVASFEEAVEISFHGVDYILTITAQSEELLIIELEQEASNQRWRGEFPSKYIEDLTRKTGNVKKFGVFVRMLLAALHQESNTVYVNLFTYADLEMLKSREARHRGSAVAASNASALSGRDANKRYLILTYVVEFDRVHYPLPLSYQEVPSAGALMRTIRRLQKDKQELQEMLANRNAAAVAATQVGDHPSRETAGLLAELDTLRRKLREAQSAAANPAALTDLRATLDAETHKRKVAEAALERLQASSRAEIGRLRDELASLHESTGGVESLAKLQAANKQLRLKCADLQKQLTAAKSATRTRPASAAAHRGSSPAPSSARTGSTSRRTASPVPASTRSRGSTTVTTPRGSRLSGRRSPSPAGSESDRGSATGSVGSRGRSRGGRPPAGAAPRFDPTAYQVERQAKLKATSDARRNPPPRSASPAGSVDRDSRGRRGPAPAASPAGSRRSAQRRRSASGYSSGSASGYSSNEDDHRPSASRGVSSSKQSHRSTTSTATSSRRTPHPHPVGPADYDDDEFERRLNSVAAKIQHHDA